MRLVMSRAWVASRTGPIATATRPRRLQTNAPVAKRRPTNTLTWLITIMMRRLFREVMRDVKPPRRGNSVGRRWTLTSRMPVGRVMGGLKVVLPMINRWIMLRERSVARLNGRRLLTQSRRWSGLSVVLEALPAGMPLRTVLTV